jgi:hypothetical protein
MSGTAVVVSPYATDGNIRLKRSTPTWATVRGHATNLTAETTTVTMSGGIAGGPRRLSKGAINPPTSVLLGAENV